MTVKEAFETQFKLGSDRCYTDGNYEICTFYKEPTSDYSAVRNLPFRLFIIQKVPITIFDYKLPALYELGISSFNNNGSHNLFTISMREDQIETIDYDTVEDGLLSALQSFKDVTSQSSPSLLFDNSSSNLLVE